MTTIDTVVIGAGAAAYAIITLLTNRQMVREVMDLFRRRPSGGGDVKPGGLS